MPVFEPHSDKQERAIFSENKILAFLTGIQFGKTTVGAIRQKSRMHEFRDKDDAFIIAAPTYKIMQQSTLPAFLKVMEGCGEYHKADAVFEMRGGGLCYCRTGTEPDSVVGITNVRGIWGDEAGKFSLYFWENLFARSAFRDCPIDLTSSPYALNWLYKQIVLPKMRSASALPHIDLIQAASWENPFMPMASIEHARGTMDPRRFNALYGGQWERMAGLVYDCFDEIENQIEPHALPAGTKYFGGIDWGYTEPFVFKVRAVLPNGDMRGVYELYRSGMTIVDIIGAVRRIYDTYGISMIYCGPDQPGYIEELNRNKLAAIAADNDVRLGIDRHYQLLRTRRLKYFRGTHPNTLDELDSYHYPAPEDIKPDENVKDAKPVQQDDHALDADRYLSVSLVADNVRRMPRVPDEKKDEDQYARIERLKRRSPSGLEEFS